MRFPKWFGALLLASLGFWIVFIALLTIIATTSAVRKPPKPRPTPTVPVPTPTPGPTFVTPTPTLVTPAPTPSPVGSVEPDPVSCTGYPEPRQFLETQAWWEPIPNVGGQGHVHLGMCWPTGGTVSGIVRLDFRTLLHGNLGTFERIKMRDDADGSDGAPDISIYVNQPSDSRGAGQEQTFWTTMYVDTRQQHDGLRQWRLYSFFIHEGGNEQVARAMYRVNVQNGKTDVGPVYSEWGGSGWYVEADGTDWGYQRATLDPASILPIGACVSGTWTPVVKLNWSSPSATEHMVLVDPNIHAGSLGTVIRQGSGGYGGPVSVNTAGMASGSMHKLFLHTANRVGTEENGGVFVYPFRVC
jgi:hypothetical protein